jgi:hypothetical protein
MQGGEIQFWGVRGTKLVGGIFVGVGQRPVEDDVSSAGENYGKSGENYGKYEEPYRNYFSTCALIVVSLLLSLGAFKSVSYAVYQNKVLFVLFAFCLQAVGVSAILYVIWSFVPFPH